MKKIVIWINLSVISQSLLGMPNNILQDDNLGRDSKQYTHNQGYQNFRKNQDKEKNLRSYDYNWRFFSNSY